MHDLVDRNEEDFSASGDYLIVVHALYTRVQQRRPPHTVRGPCFELFPSSHIFSVVYMNMVMELRKHQPPSDWMKHVCCCFCRHLRLQIV